VFEPLGNFKFALEATKGWVGEGGTAKEVTVAEFPISRSIAGVSMRLKAGGLRESHWHPNADEWHYWGRILRSSWLTIFRFRPIRWAHGQTPSAGS
jgi:hypothetical protein